MPKAHRIVLEDLVKGTADYIKNIKKKRRFGIASITGVEANMMFDTIIVREKSVSISYREKELATWETPKIDYKHGETLKWILTEGIMKVRLD